jgi:nucleotide-binding universal stress UspA family protein
VVKPDPEEAEMRNAPETSSKRRVLWAVDPFDLEAKPSPVEVERLTAWLRQSFAELVPAYVYSSISSISSQGKIASNQELLLKGEVTQFAWALGLGEYLSNQVEATIIPDWYGSTGSSVDALIGFAQELGAEVIIVTSRGLAGMKRLALGSFAETLLLHSPVPVRVFGHGRSEEATCVDSAVPSLLFALDLSNPSKQAFELSLKECSRRGAGLVIFHYVQRLTPITVDPWIFGTGKPFPSDAYLLAQIDWAEARGSQLADEARAHGVAARVLVRAGSGKPAEEILRAAREVGATEIAMATSSGPIAAVLVGSVAREVARESELPVIVFGPRLGKWPANPPVASLAEG